MFIANLERLVGSTYGVAEERYEEGRRSIRWCIAPCVVPIETLADMLAESWQSIELLKLVGCKQSCTCPVGNMHGKKILAIDISL